MLETKYTKKLYSAIRKLNLDQEELKGLFLCLYINGCSSEDCAKLFGTTEDKIVNFLESEKLYGYKACIQCDKLKDRVEGFRQYKDRKSMICKDCKNEYDKKYKENNKERIQEYKDKYNKEYWKNNKEKIKEYKENNKEKIKEHRNKYNKEYYKNNKEDFINYNKNNKEKIKEYSKNRFQSEASAKHVQKLATYEEVSGNQIRCKYCGRWTIPTIQQVNDRLRGINDNDKCYIYCSEECKQECPTYGQKKYPKGFKPASSREVNSMLRQLVLARDNYTCQKCGKSQDVRLHCHHIIPAVNSPIEANDPKNCITLCKDCHKLVHKLPGCGYNELKCA